MAFPNDGPKISTPAKAISLRNNYDGKGPTFSLSGFTPMTTDAPPEPDDFDDDSDEEFGDDFEPEEPSAPGDELFVHQYGQWCGWQDGTPEEEAEDLGTGPLSLRIRPGWSYSFQIYHNDLVEADEGLLDPRVRAFCERVGAFPQLRTLHLGEQSLLSDAAF